MGVQELMQLGIGLCVAFVVFGALIGSVVTSLNRTAYTGLTTAEGANMDTLRGWYFLAGLLLVIGAVAAYAMTAFRA